MKCIEFSLPSGSAGMAAGLHRQVIVRQLSQLKEKHSIDFKTNTDYYKLYVWLKNDSDYTLFFLVWDSTSVWRVPALIEKDYPENWGSDPWTES